MGLWDRIEKMAGETGNSIKDVATGVFGAAQAPFGLVKDFVTAPFVDEEEFDGFWNVLLGRSTERGGQVIQNLFGADEGVGAVVRALPEDIIRKPANRVFGALETGYREGVAEPLSTEFGAQNRAADNTFERITGTLFGLQWGAPSGEDYRESAKDAETTSPGQAFALGVSGTDVRDEEARRIAEESGWFNPLSGSFDAAFRLFGDPTVLVGGAAGAARKAVIIKPITGATDLDAVLGTNGVAKFNEALEGKTADEIRDQFFPNDINGAALSSALAEAGDAQTRMSIIRLGAGDMGELRKLAETRADIAGRLERLLDDQSLLRSMDQDNFAKVNRRSKAPTVGPVLDEDAGAGAALSSELERTEAEINTLFSAEERAGRNTAVFGQIRNVPRYSRKDATRVAVTRSHFYQSSPLAAPLRVTFNMRPPSMLDLNDPAGDVAATQFLRKAGLDKQEQGVWRTRYMAVSSPEGRMQVATEMEDYALARLAEHNGLTRQELDTLMSTVNKGRQNAREALASRVYDGEGRSLLRFKDDATGEMHEYPLLVSQTANVLPLGNVEKVRKSLTRIGEFKQRHPGTAVPNDMLTGFNNIWKPSVLLRVGWPIRVVGDEQMRIMGKLGALTQMKYAATGFANKVNNEVAKAAIVATRGVDEKGVRLSPEQALEQAAMEGRIRKIGFGTNQVGDYHLPAVFGEDVANPNAAFNLTASKPTFDKMFKDVETAEMNKLREATKDYRTIMPHEPDYAASWSNAVNQQLGRDPLARIFLEGGDLEDGVAWLNSTAGRDHQRRLPMRRTDLDAWAGAVQDQVESYTLGNADIALKALKQQASPEDLFRLAPDAAARPPVHGEVLKDALGRGPAITMLANFRDKMYNALGSVPSDTLSRHPFADAMYQAEAKRLTDIMDAQVAKEGRRLNADDLKLVENRSREYAIDQTRKLLYELSEESDLAHLLKFASPFFSAWQETMTRWAGIAIENPAYAMRLRQVWKSPERAGIVTDENGNVIAEGDKEGDKTTLPDGTVAVIGKERFITFSVPKWAKDVPVVGDGFKNQAAITLNKKSFNMILQGNPGVGVPVQIPVNEIVRHRPDLAESIKAVLPFGPTDDYIGMVMPAVAKRINSRASGEEDRTFKNAALRIYFDKVTDYNLGKRAEPPTWDEAMKDTSAFYAMRTVASYVSPAAPGFKSPYQLQIDAYRRLREQDIETADEKFLDLYGEEYFALTQSFTRSADGVAPTKEAFLARSKYRDLIEKSPELGGLIIGEEGSGEYNSAIYQYQLANKVKPGSTTNQRFGLSFDEVSGGPNTRLGWIEYRKVADLIDAERIERGLPNMRVKGAQDLAMLRKAMVAKLAEKYPEWHEAFQKN